MAISNGWNMAACRADKQYLSGRVLITYEYALYFLSFLRQVMEK